VCKGADNDEFALFLWTCKKHKLDPITKQIYAVFRNVSKHHQDEKGIWIAGRQMTIQMGIDGLRALAGRHHRDFGGADEPTFVMSGTKTPAGRPIPESATVRLWKKGLEHPIVGVAYWDEFAPRDLSETKADFYNRMPRHMLAKCAEALAIRKGYPDLSDIYTDAEMVQADQEYTPEGRIITDANGFTASGRAVTYEANRQLGKARQAEVLDEKLGHGHEPGSDKAKMAEAALARVEAADKELAETKMDIKQEPPQVAPLDSKHEEAKPRGTIELVHSADQGTIIRGDIGDLVELIQKHCTATWKDDWWHILPTDVSTIHAMGKQLNYRIVEIFPKDLPPKGKTERKETPKTTTASAGKSQSPGAEPFIVKGTIERVFVTLKGEKSFAMVTIKTPEGAKREAGCWDKDIYGYLDKGKGKEAEVFFQTKGQYTNITGLKRIGRVEFEHNKVPILNRDREPGAAGNLFQP
jgi:phage recombination protein Bet